MSQVMVPSIGSKLTLTSDWTFVLHHEYRNESLLTALGLTIANNGSGIAGSYKTTDATLPSGTVLRVDRFYVRRGQKDYDSITFIVDSCPAQLQQAIVTSRWSSKHKTRKQKPRFWVKLYDANTIQCEFDKATMP